MTFDQKLFSQLEENYKITAGPEVLLGCVSDQDLELLSDLIEKANALPGPVVEIGTLFGRTSHFIEKKLAPEKELILVDNFSWNPCGLSPQQHKELLLTMLGDFKHKNVSLVSEDKDLFYSKTITPPSLVFLDADHEYLPTLNDIKWAQKVGAQIICGHDYHEIWPGVIQAVEECGGAQKIQGTLWLLNDKF